MENILQETKPLYVNTVNTEEIEEIEIMDTNRKYSLEYSKELIKQSIELLIKENLEKNRSNMENTIKKLLKRKKEILISIYLKNKDTIFIFEPKIEKTSRRNHPLRELKKLIEQAQIIEMVYPDLFTWIFNGKNINAIAIIPSSKIELQGIFTRYGSVIKFINVMNKNLINVIKSKTGEPIDNNYFKINNSLKRKYFIPIGSINKETGLFCIPINIYETIPLILKKAKYNKFDINTKIKYLDMKYWIREINPDSLYLIKRPKLKNPVEINFENYPLCIKNIMNLQRKGDKNRYNLIRFLLSIHHSDDAKHVLFSILNEEELEHITKGDSKAQFRTILNNLDRYGCPNCFALSQYCEKECKLNHPLERFQ